MSICLMFKSMLHSLRNLRQRESLCAVCMKVLHVHVCLCVYVCVNLMYSHLCMRTCRVCECICVYGGLCPA